MASVIFDGTLLTQTFSLDPIDSIIVLVLAILSTGLNVKLLNKEECFEGQYIKDTYYTINFFGFLFLFFAFMVFLKESGYVIGLFFVLICEALFWQSLRFSRRKEETSYSVNYHYNQKISFVNTSLVSALYFLFIIIMVISSNFSIAETNVNIFGTLLLISVFKSLYGVFTGETYVQFAQLHIYSYLFIFLAMIISSTSGITSLSFNVTGYFLALYSANEIARYKNNFYIFTFRTMAIILFFTGFFLSNLTSTYMPLITFSAIALVIIGTLVRLREQNYDKDRQSILFYTVIGSCFILYYLLTGEIFLLSDIIKGIIQVLDINFSFNLLPFPNMTI
ncbi:hypothetical protein [Methanolobus sp. WCC4]|uniref:hypothetical protein n=1 Tax=Methanolobus sp. WCC4 TaxID=3125784 RepID=UPI0030FC8051